MSRDVLCVSGTQLGKTYVLAAWIVGQAFSHGPAHPWWWTAPTYKQAEQGLDYVKAFAGPLVAAVNSSPPAKIKLANGATIEFRSWDQEQHLMGTAIAGGVVDEAGLLTPEAQAALSSRRSSTLGPLRYIGNPGVVAGPFRKLCALGEQAAVSGSEWAGVYSLHKWSWTDKYNALLLSDSVQAAAYRQFIEQERTSLPEFEFRRLYEAEWTEDEAAVFRNVPDPVGPPVLEPNGETYIFGVDVAQETDYLVAIGVGLQSRRAAVMDRWRGIPYPQSADRLQALSEKWNGAPLVIETNGPGLPLYQELAQRNVPVVAFTTTGPSKQEIIVNLSSELEHGRLTLCDLPPLHYELRAFRYERMASGNYRYSAPAGEHDDTVMALAFACWGLRNTFRLNDFSGYGWA